MHGLLLQYSNALLVGMLDCGVGAWGAWATCDVTSETKVCERTVRTKPSKSGKKCPALREEAECHADCEVSAWGTWATCDATSGSRARERTVRTKPSKSGQKCPAFREETTCKVDCEAAGLGGCVQHTLGKCRVCELLLCTHRGTARTVPPLKKSQHVQ